MAYNTKVIIESHTSEHPAVADYPIDHPHHRLISWRQKSLILAARY